MAVTSSYSWFGDKAARAFPFIMLVLLTLGLFWNGWWIWAALLLWLGRVHAEPLDQITPLDSTRLDNRRVDHPHLLPYVQPCAILRIHRVMIHRRGLTLLLVVILLTACQPGAARSDCCSTQPRHEHSQACPDARCRVRASVSRQRP